MKVTRERLIGFLAVGLTFLGCAAVTKDAQFRCGCLISGGLIELTTFALYCKYYKNRQDPDIPEDEKTSLSRDLSQRDDTTTLQRYERSFMALRHLHDIIRSTYLDQNKQFEKCDRDEHLKEALYSLGDLVEGSRTFIHAMEKDYQQSKEYLQRGCEKIHVQKETVIGLALTWDDSYRALLQENGIECLPAWDAFVQNNDSSVQSLMPAR